MTGIVVLHKDCNIVVVEGGRNFVHSLLGFAFNIIV